MNNIVRALVVTVVSLPTLAVLASNVSIPPPSAAQTGSEKVPNGVGVSAPQDEPGFLEKQRQKLKDRRAALAAAARSNRYCAGPTYGRKDGKAAVIIPGHCDSGGFGEHGEGTPSVAERQRKSAL